MKNEMLPDELLWEGGHASELALTALADGEAAILPANVTGHIDACAECMHRVGDAALFSAALGSAIGAMNPLVRVQPVAVPVKRRAPLPLPAIAAAIVVALIGAAPTLVHLPNRFAELCLAVLHALPTLSRSSAQLLRSGLGPTWMMMTFASAVLLLMMSVGITRILPRPAEMRPVR
jgi:hypothetical protein